MSLLTAAKARSSRLAATPPRPRLTVVPKMSVRAPRVPFVALVVLVLSAGLVGLLVLNTSLQQGAYKVTALKQTSADLALRQQNLELQVSALESPHRISRQAVRLGMVANESPTFLSLSTGRVMGVAVPGSRANRPVLGTAPDPVASVSAPAKSRALVAGERSTGTTPVQTVEAALPSSRTAAPERGAEPSRPDDTTSTSTPRKRPRDTTDSGR